MTTEQFDSHRIIRKLTEAVTQQLAGAHIPPEETVMAYLENLKAER